MVAWEERLTRCSNPTLVHEHVLRYRFASPLVRSSAVWLDLGCGTGVSSTQALDDGFDGLLILVDYDEQSMQLAAREARAQEVLAVQADLANHDGLASVRDAALEAAARGSCCVTCFEVLEHLDDFVGLAELLIELATQNGFDVIASVPNDAFFAIENPHHKTRWSGPALEEFRRMLPEGHVIAHQYPLTGSLIEAAAAGAPSEHHLRLWSSEKVPSHYLMAFGPRTSTLRAVAGVIQTDLERQRAWERQREADLEYYRQRTGELEHLIAQQSASAAGAARAQAQADQAGAAVQT